MAGYPIPINSPYARSLACLGPGPFYLEIMPYILPPDWPETAAAATRIQNELRHQVRLMDDFDPPETIAGIDVGFDTLRQEAKASVVLLDADTLAVRAQVTAYQPVSFPYVPGYLSFREIPVLLQALSALPESPGLLMVDGQGIAHPRRFGIAAHLGIITGLPALGVAKSVLCGTYHEPGPEKGDTSLLLHKGEKIGTVLRSKDGVKPLFISPGHRITHDRAVAWVLKCLTKYRLPEPTRLADKYSKSLKPAPAVPGFQTMAGR